MNPKFGLSNERVLFFILYIFKSHASAENDSLCSIDQNSLHITCSSYVKPPVSDRRLSLLSFNCLLCTKRSIRYCRHAAY